MAIASGMVKRTLLAAIVGGVNYAICCLLKKTLPSKRIKIT